MTEGRKDDKLDAFAAICADLEEQQRTKRRHFTPALLIVVALAVVMLGVVRLFSVDCEGNRHP